MRGNWRLGAAAAGVFALTACGLSLEGEQLFPSEPDDAGITADAGGGGRTDGNVLDAAGGRDATLLADGSANDGSPTNDATVGPDATNDGPDPDVTTDTGADAPPETGPADTGPADTGPADTGPADTGTTDAGCGPVCSLNPAQGFTLVSYAKNPSATCPESFTQNDGEEDPIAGPGACECGQCFVTANPSCVKGSFSTSDGPTAQCGIPGANLSANNGNCTTLGGVTGLSKYSGVGNTTPHGGACTSPTITNAGAVTTTPARLCVPTGCATACEQVGPGFATCMAKSGNAGCPPAAPNKHLVGTDVSLNCPACGCNVSATCSGALDLFASNNCTGTPKTIPSNTCTELDGGTAQTYEWSGTANGVTCNTVLPPFLGQPTMSGTLTTVCCP